MKSKVYVNSYTGKGYRLGGAPSNRNYYGSAMNALKYAKYIPKVYSTTRALYNYAYGKKDKGPVSVTDNSSRTIRVKNNRQRRSNKKVTLKKVTKSLREVNRKINSGMGVLTHRQRTTGRVVNSVAQQAQLNIAVIHLNYLESVLGQLRYYDPAAPSALVTADGTTGSYSKQFRLTINTKLVLRNNYQVPTKVTVYLCKCKSDTNIDPVTAFTQGLADVGNPSSSSPLTYVSDSPQFKDLWKILKTTKMELSPGAEMKLTHSEKSFTYDPSVQDSHALTYQTEFKSLAYFVRVEGVLGHDTSVSTEQGFLQSGVDYCIDKIAKVDYQAGADIEFVYVSDASAATFTNNPVISAKPVVDNQNYSVA